MDRRKFLKDIGLAAGGLATSAMLPNAEDANAETKGQGSNKLWRHADGRPNILVIIVDQLRFPQGLFNQTLMDIAAPNIAQLRSESVSFEQQYAAAAMCSPSRSCMLTGLYTHQNGMFLTNAKGLVDFSSPNLEPGFPTYGSILNDSDFKYNTYWWGKWHLSSNDATTPNFAEQYGFNDGGLPCPAPNGAPGQGLGVDPVTYDVFSNWLDEYTTSDSGPWCTTVSLTNPHDIAWFPKYTNGNPPTPGEDDPPSIFHSLPANFERWPEAIALQGKPRWQLTFVELIDLLIGFMPTNPILPDYPEIWHQFLDLYAQVTHYVDIQIGKVLQALEDNGVADNTIVVFTSDHGEYAGSHGMRNKGYTVYEESIHVPLYIKDPTETFVPANQVGTTRSQFTSHVDLVPLLMTLASGNNNWRDKKKYAHLAGRADICSMLNDPSAPGRDYIITSTDEDVPSEAHQSDTPLGDIRQIIQNNGNPPGHVIGYRTSTAKLGVYSYFAPGTIDIMVAGQEAELYNYQSDGIDEVINHAPGGSAPDQTLFTQLYNALFNPTSGAVANELRQPLPRNLRRVQRRAFKTYLAYQAAIGQ